MRKLTGEINPFAFIDRILTKSTSEDSDVHEMFEKFKEIYEINSMFPILNLVDYDIIYDDRNCSKMMIQSWI